jgi:hypothetical protein
VLKIYRPPVDEFIGKQFGNLTVVAKTNERQTGHVMWKCRCICGKFTRVRTTRLLHGVTQSCGKCLR